jgi:hypothetical protein
MESRLQDAIKSAADALANMADEADKLSQELSELKARVDRQDDFNRKMKLIFDEFYGGQG